VIAGSVDSATAIALGALVAALSGCFGAVVGALLTSRHDRRERFKALRVESATALVRACAEALLQTSFAVSTAERRLADKLEGHMTADEAATEMKDAVDQARKSIARAAAKRALVQLLFGTESPTERSGAALLAHLRRAADALEPPHFDVIDATEHHMDAALEMEALSETATNAILQTGTARDYLSRTTRLRRRSHPPGHLYLHYDEIDHDLSRPPNAAEKSLQSGR
jgi:hypothetical protein